MPQTTNTAPLLHKRGLHDLVALGQTASVTNGVWSKFVGESRKGPNEISLVIAGKDEMPRAQAVAEGEAVPASVRTVPFTMVVTYKHFALSYRYTQIAEATDHYQDLEDGVMQMIQSMYDTRELEAANLLNLGFTAPSSGGTQVLEASSSIPLFNASHTIHSGLSTSAGNLLTASPLSYGNLEAAVQQAQQTVTHRGKAWNYGGRYTLAVPNQLSLLAKRIVSSTLRPGTGDNDPNVVGGSIEVLHVPYLTSATSWFLIPKDSSVNPFCHYELISPQSDMKREMNPMRLEYFSSMSHVFFAKRFRGVVGVQGV